MSGSSTRPGALKRRRDVPERRIVDSVGRKWSLYEVEPAVASPSTEGSSLIAEDDGVIRRLWTFPSDWYRMSDSQLADLVERPVRQQR